MIGILALQGDFIQHAKMIHQLQQDYRLVRTADDLAHVDRLILPGGESTTMRLLAQKHGLWSDLKVFCKTHPVFGTCAGAILLAQTIDSEHTEESLQAIDITINRNSYGRQIDSFVTDVVINFPRQDAINISAIFIRAPQITTVGKHVDILASYDDSPILLQQKNCLVATFHPELTSSTLIHQYFCN